jgi:hypothetical protein
LMVILFVLQNAYRSEKYNFRNDDEWYRDLMRSHTGRRLSEMIPDGIDVRVVNATPKIGNDPCSFLKPEQGHIRNMINRFKPDVICACGKSAQTGCEQLGIDFISLPHPAWRHLSKKVTGEIRAMLGSLIEEEL